MPPHRWNKESFAHKMVADVQVGMANEIYDALATARNDFYKAWPDKSEFVNKVAPTLRDHARNQLASMLARHDVPDADKEAIYEALLLDKVIPNEDRFWVPNPPLIH